MIVKKLNDSTIQRLKSLKDTDMVTITDKSSGAVSMIDFGTLKSLVIAAVAASGLVMRKKSFLTKM